MSGHTPTPWGLTVHGTMSDGVTMYWLNDRTSIGTSNRANAELIVRAVNSHEELVSAAHLLDGICAWLLHRFGPDTPEGREAALRQPKAVAAIAKAEGLS